MDRGVMRTKDIVKRPLLRTLAGLGRHIGGFFTRPVKPGRPWRALVIQLGGIGDVLRVFPVVERLLAADPQADVTLFTNLGADLLDLFPGPQRPRHVLFDLNWSYPRKLRELMKLRRAGLDLVISPVRGDGMLECAVIAWLSGAPHRIGFDRDGAGFLHTHKQPFADGVSILEQNLRLLDALDIPERGTRLCLRIPEPARAFAADWYARHVPPDYQRIVVHPWASSHDEFRAWPIVRYAELMRDVIAARRVVMVVLGGDAEASRDRARLDGLPADRVFNLAGAVRLNEAAALIAGCDLFVGNDSGLLHFALAAEVPAVVVFGATPPAQVLHTSRHAIPVVSGVPCQPCYRHQPFFDYRCAHGFRCLSEVPVGTVLREILRNLPERGMTLLPS